MESSSIASRALLLLLLLVLRSCARADNEDTEVDLDTRAIRDFYPKDPNLTSEKQLVSCINLKHMLKSFFFLSILLMDQISLNYWLQCFHLILCSWNMLFFFYQLGALHEVLEKLQMKRIPPWEKKFGQVPMVIRCSLNLCSYNSDFS